MDEWIKNIPHAKSLDLTEQIKYETGKVVRKTLVQRSSVGIILFTFDAGESVSAHTVPGDAMAHILDGEAEVTIGGKVHWVTAGHVIVMPAGVSHAVRALTPFKMLLTVVKES